MSLDLIPILHDEEHMKKYLETDFCINVFNAFKSLYARVGFHLPWIGYFAMIGNDIVSTGGFKGSPEGGKMEIAYGVVPEMDGPDAATKPANGLYKLRLKRIRACEYSENTDGAWGLNKYFE